MGISHEKKGEWVDRTSLINRRLTTNQGYTLPFLNSKSETHADTTFWEGMAEKGKMHATIRLVVQV